MVFSNFNMVNSSFVVHKLALHFNILNY
jgi:hypothetical protein